MMASSSELSADYKPQSYSVHQKSFADQPADHQSQTQNLEEFLARLEEERLKIEAFKRELPLCMTLLTNAMEASRQQLQSYCSNKTLRPVLEEFIPLKDSLISECSDHKALKMSDKANWMTSAQLWSQTTEGTKQPPTMLETQKEIEIGLNISPEIDLDTKQRNEGVFMPFPKDCGSGSNGVSPNLTLANCVDHKETEDKKFLEIDNGARENCGKPIIEHGQKGNVQINTQMTTTAVSNNAVTSQAHRKVRRCWSPDLHRRFVNALQILGGSQVATPKQIRELMKVDGLTNDEVKSHLQKYRLHTRRPTPIPHSAGGPPHQLVVLSSIWMPPEYAATQGGAPSTLYSAHPATHAPMHYCAPEMPHEVYPAAATVAAHHHPMQLHHQLHVYKPPPSPSQRMPESEAGGVGDQSESIEDGKSDSGSWKERESGGEMGAERSGLAALRGEGEESNGSGITLKF